MDVTINSISRELTDDFLHFFDKTAFTDNKDWTDAIVIIVILMEEMKNGYRLQEKATDSPLKINRRR